MKEQKLNLNELIVVEQLPKITETLEMLSGEIEKRIENALSLPASEETKQSIKSARADLNKIKSTLEERRKFVKEQILKPYSEFENVYNELVKDKLENADKVLKERISDIEIAQRQEKINALIDFANEYIEFYGLTSIVKAKNVIPNVTLSKSEKALKSEIKGKLEGIANEINIIKQDENKEDLLVEYLKDFNYSRAKLEIMNRKAEKEKVSTVFATNEDLKPFEETFAVEEITRPVEIVEQELIECEFKVLATKEQLLQIKNYLKELGVKYE